MTTLRVSQVDFAPPVGYKEPAKEPTNSHHVHEEEVSGCCSVVASTGVLGKRLPHGSLCPLLGRHTRLRLVRKQQRSDDFTCTFQPMPDVQEYVNSTQFRVSRIAVQSVARNFTV